MTPKLVLVAILSCVGMTAETAGAKQSSEAKATDKAYDQCLDRASSNVDFTSCGAAYLKRLDVALNAAWRRTNSSLDQQSREELLKEQRTWLQFKKASCLIWAKGPGREGQVLHFYGCRGSVIEARISDLNGMYELMHQDRR